MKKFVLNVPLTHKADGFAPIECVVERIVTIPQRHFDEILEHPLQDSPYIAENKQYMWNDGDTAHCVLFLSYDTDDGILVQCEGYDCARRSQFIPDAKNLVFASGFTAPENRIHDSLMKMAEEAARLSHQGETSLNFKELADKMGLWDGTDDCAVQMENETVMRSIWRDPIRWSRMSQCDERRPENWMAILLYKGVNRFICINTVGRKVLHKNPDKKYREGSL